MNSILKFHKLHLLLLLPMAILGIIGFLSLPVSAIDPDDFNPGRIIDDLVFTNSDSMTITQIQDFLESKVPECDTNGDKTHNGVLRKNYSSTNKPPFTCLKDYYENPTTQENNYGGAPKPSGAKSAARIIWEAGQNHDINPQVLIVTLQKENSLVTDDWPWEGQFERAMGYGCPDTAPCDAEYFGFANQVNKAAWQFRRYLDNPSGYNYAVGSRYVQYHPSSSCGGKTISIQTAATAALYNYTPYQPNTTSLNNYPGTGNSCSSYGNRNFWFKFQEWFGSTLTPDYDASVVEADRVVYLKPSTAKEITVKFRNTGTGTWYGAVDRPSGESPVVLASSNPLYSISKFNAAFQRDDRPAVVFTNVYKSDGTLECGACQSRVLPGQIAEYTFTITAPTDIDGATTYDQYFSLVRQPNTFIYKNLKVEVKVPSAQTEYDIELQSGYRGARPGWELSSFIKLKNTGNTTWFNNSSAILGASNSLIATANPTGRLSIFSELYSSGNAPTVEFDRVDAADGSLAPDQDTVLPGESVVFRFTMKVPESLSPGIYEEPLSLRFKGLPKFIPDGKTANIKLKVLSPLN